MGPLLCELHAHTTWSDGDLRVAELVDLHGRNGFDVLCVTDHTVRSDDPWRERERLLFRSVEATTWHEHLTLAVNLSPVQFKSGTLVQTVASALAASGLLPSRLELEITESVLLQNSTNALATLGRLRGLGVRVAIDDFGTGYSSLSYLRNFPFDKIKLDRSFIRDLGRDNETSLAIMGAVARLGSALGISTTAEGVETDDQLQIVRAEGYTELQGFLISPPRPAGEIDPQFRAPLAQSGSDENDEPMSGMSGASAA